MGGTENTDRVSYEVVDNAAPYVPAVFSCLWERGVKELRGLGYTVDEAAQKAIDFCNTDESKALLVNGVPVFVVGAVNGVTWFQATEDFTKHYRAITRCIRDLAKRKDYVIYSQCVHPRTEAWFRMCGFVRDEYEGETVTGTKLYRFRRNENVL